jgi:hypothetical protein
MLRPRWQHLLLIALSLCASSVMAVPDELKSDVLSGSAAITGIDQFNTKLDGGGNFHWGGIIAQGELKRQLTTTSSSLPISSIFFSSSLTYLFLELSVASFTSTSA